MDPLFPPVAGLSFASTPAGLVTDEDAAILERDLPGLRSNPDLYNLGVGKLNEHRAFRSIYPRPLSPEEEKERVDGYTRLESLFEDFDKATEGQQLETLRTATPEEAGEIKASLSGQAFVRYHTGQVFDGPEWEANRDGLADKLFEGRGKGSDTAFHAETKAWFAKNKATREQLQSYAEAGAADALTLDGASVGKRLAEIQGTATTQGDNRDANVKAYTDARNATETKLAPYRGKANSILGLLKIAGGKDKGGTDLDLGYNPIERAVDLLVDMPEDVRPLVIAAMAKKPGKDESGSAATGLFAYGRAFAGQVRGMSSANERTALSYFIGKLQDPEPLTIPTRLANDPEGLKALVKERAGLGLLAPFQPYREETTTATPEQRAQLLQISSRELDRNKVAGQVRGVLEGTVDPIKGAGLSGKIGVDVAASLGAMTPSFIPYAGLVIAQGGFAEQEFQRQIQLGTPAEQAHTISQATGAVQAGLDRAQALLAFKLPWSKGLTSAAPLSKVPGSALAQATIATAGVQAGEYAIESLQDATPIATAYMAETLGMALPEAAQYKAEFDRWGPWNPEMFLTLLPLSLVGGGFQGLSNAAESRRYQADLLADPVKMTAVGIQPGAAQTIAAMAPHQRADAYKAAYESRTPEAPEAVAARAAVVAEVKAEAQVAQAQQAAVGVTAVRRTADGWTVDMEDGTTVPVDSTRAAEVLVKDLKQAGTVAEAEALISVADNWHGKATGETSRQTKFTGAVAVADEAGITYMRGGKEERVELDATSVRNLREEVDLLDNTQGTGAVSALVLGQNRVFAERVAEGAKAVVRALDVTVNQGPQNVLTLVHEQVEAIYRKGAKEGTITPEETAAAFRAVAPALSVDALPASDAEGRKFREAVQRVAAGQATETETRETLSELVVADVLGRRKDGSVMPAGTITRGVEAAIRESADPTAKAGLQKFLAFLRAVRTYFRAVFGTAAALNKARRDGTLEQGGDWESFVNKLLEVDEQVAHTKAVAAEVVAAVAQPMGMVATGNPNSDEDVGFSLGGKLDLAGARSRLQAAARKPSTEAAAEPEAAGATPTHMSGLLDRLRAKPADVSKVTLFPDGAELTGPTTFSIRAFHGTPHKVDKFSTSKIGTGEGAQVYGWGLYFAQNRSIAEWYKEQLGNRPESQRFRGTPANKLTSAEEWVFSAFSWKRKDPDYNFEDTRSMLRVEGADALRGARRRWELAKEKEGTEDFQQDSKWGKLPPIRHTPEKTAEAKSWMELWERRLELVGEIKESDFDWGAGNLYEVELAPDEERFLHWDKPLREQSAAIQQVAIPLLSEKYAGTDREGRELDTPGFLFYTALEMGGGGARQASKKLAEMGIPGIMYLDANSRDGSGGTSNFVLFDENLVRILEENGKPVQEAEESFSVSDTDRWAAMMERIDRQKAAEAGGAPYRIDGIQKGFDASDNIVPMFQQVTILEPGHPAVGSTLSIPLEGRPAPLADSVIMAAVNAKREDYGATFSVGSEAFKNWFGNSKVVDKEGAPLVVHHGAPDVRGIFSEGFRGFSRGAVWFAAEDRETAGTYADDRRALDYQNAEPGVIPLFLSIQNPMEVDAKGQSWKGTAQKVEEAKAAGHDGIIIRNTVDPYQSGMVKRPTAVFAWFSPTQAKSALASSMASRVDGKPISGADPNSGAWSPDNPGISFAPAPADALERIMAIVEKRFARDPEARHLVARTANQRLQALAYDWSSQRQYYGAKGKQSGTAEPVTERRTIKSLDREQRTREALEIADEESKMWDALSNSAVASLGMGKGESSAFAGPLAQRFTGGRFGTKGRIMSKRDAILLADSGDFKMGGEYDGAAGIPSMFFGGSLSADLAAQEAYEAGEIPEPTPDALWSAIASELQTQKGIREAYDAAVATVKAMQKQVKATARENAKRWREKMDAEQARDHSPRASLLRDLRTLDAILSAMPAEVRARVGGFVKLATLGTDKARAEEIIRRIDTMSELMEKYLQSETMEAMEALVEQAQAKREAGKKPTGTLGAEGHRYFDAVAAVLHMTDAQMTGRRAEITEAMAGVPDATGNMVPPPDSVLADLWEQEQILDAFGGFARKDAASMDAAYRAAAEVYATHRNRWRMIEEARLEQVRGLVKQTVSALGGASDAQIQAAKKAAAKLKNMVAGQELDMQSFTGFLEQLLGADHPLAVRWSRMAHEGRAQANDEVRAAMRRFREVLQRATGQKGYKAQRVLYDMAKVQTITVAKPTHVTPSTISVPIAMIDAWAAGTADPAQMGVDAAEAANLMADRAAMTPEDRRQSMPANRVETGPVESVGLTEAEGVFMTLLWGQEGYKEALRRAGWDTEAMDTIEAGLSPAAAILRGHLLEEYRDNYAPLAAVFERMYGVALPQIKNYAPAAFYHQGQERTMDPNGATDSTGGMRQGMLANRKRHTAAPRMENAFASYFGHVNQTAYWRGMAEMVREFSAVMNNPTVKRALEGKGGAPALKETALWIQSLSGDGLQVQSGMIDEAVGWLLSAYSRVSLAWKLGTLLKQSSALTGAAHRMPGGAYASRLAKLMAGQLEFSRMFNSPAIQRRLETGFSPEVRAAMNRTFTSKPNAVRAAIDTGMELIGYTDAFFTAGSAAILYDWHFGNLVKNGMEENAAHEAAMVEVEDMISRTAQPADSLDRSLFEQRLGVPGKLMFMFASEARQKSALWWTAWRHTLTGKATQRDINTLVLLHLVVAPAMQAISAVWRDMRDDDDETLFDPENWDPMDFIKAALWGPLSGIPILRDVLSNFGSSGPGSRIVQGWDSVAKLVKGPEKSKEPVEFYADHVSKVLQALPSAQAGVAGSVAVQAFDLVDNLVDDTTEEAKQRKTRINREKKERRERKD